ncbi:hypothetical protein SNEBB_004152 [Seison nebaliae]|nr:hypothetical protein SNEBB_004152 [Seison nebaliae]
MMSTYDISLDRTNEFIVHLSKLRSSCSHDEIVGLYEKACRMVDRLPRECEYHALNETLREEEKKNSVREEKKRRRARSLNYPSGFLIRIFGKKSKGEKKANLDVVVEKNCEKEKTEKKENETKVEIVQKKEETSLLVTPLTTKKTSEITDRKKRSRFRTFFRRHKKNKNKPNRSLSVDEPKKSRTIRFQSCQRTSSSGVQTVYSPFGLIYKEHYDKTANKKVDVKKKSIQSDQSQSVNDESSYGPHLKVNEFMYPTLSDRKLKPPRRPSHLPPPVPTKNVMVNSFVQTEDFPSALYNSIYLRSINNEKKLFESSLMKHSVHCATQTQKSFEDQFERTDCQSSGNYLVNHEKTLTSAPRRPSSVQRSAIIQKAKRTPQIPYDEYLGAQPNKLDNSPIIRPMKYRNFSLNNYRNSQAPFIKYNNYNYDKKEEENNLDVDNIQTPNKVRDCYTIETISSITSNPMSLNTSPISGGRSNRVLRGLRDIKILNSTMKPKHEITEPPENHCSVALNTTPANRQTDDDIDRTLTASKLERQKNVVNSPFKRSIEQINKDDMFSRWITNRNRNSFEKEPVKLIYDRACYNESAATMTRISNFYHPKFYRRSIPKKPEVSPSIPSMTTVSIEDNQEKNDKIRNFFKSSEDSYLHEKTDTCQNSGTSYGIASGQFIDDDDLDNSQRFPSPSTNRNAWKISGINGSNEWSGLTQSWLKNVIKKSPAMAKIEKVENPTYVKMTELFKTRINDCDIEALSISAKDKQENQSNTNNNNSMNNIENEVIGKNVRTNYELTNSEVNAYYRTTIYDPYTTLDESQQKIKKVTQED